MPVLPKNLLVLAARLQTMRTAWHLQRKKTAVPAQRRAFRGLLKRFARTSFGHDVGLEADMTYAQFQARVPLQTHEQLAPYVDRMRRGESDVLWPGRCAFFAITSGTTDGPVKSVPFTWEMLEHFRRANREALRYYCARVGNCHVFQGRHLQMGGSAALTLIPEATEHTAYEGDLSALTALNMPGWISRHYYEPGADIAQMTDWPEKLAAIAQRTRKVDVTLVAGMPNWLLVLADMMRPGSSRAPIGSRPPSLQNLWPNLECLMHGGLPLGPFHAELRRAYGHTVHFHEVYTASEGFIAAQDATAVEGLRLMADSGLFFEFLPLRDFDEDRLATLGPKTVPLQDVRANEDYALVLTTPGGLCRYVVGDIVRFVSTEPPRLIYVGRTSLKLNAFGERVIEKELTDSLLAVCGPHGWSITNFHVAPVFHESLTGAHRGRHEWWVELRPGSVETPTGPTLAAQLDAELRARNSEYDLKRRSLALEPPIARLVMPGVFEHWMRHHGKWGGQNRLPRCRSDRDIADELMQIARFNE